MDNINHDEVNKRAKKRWIEFNESREKYLINIEKVLGPEKHFRIPRWIVVWGETGRNTIRFSKDQWFRLKNVGQGNDLNNCHIKIHVMQRNALFEDPELINLWNIEKNRSILATFAREELYREILECHWLLIEGLTLKEFHKLAWLTGYNPRTFLSGDRGENDGRVAIDNDLEQGKPPFVSSESNIFHEESKYWEKLFPETRNWLPWSKWSTSRTHGVVYFVKDNKEEVKILFPVHIDPKNAVAFFKRKKHNERGALEYHQIPKGDDKNYIGTGLFDLGCKYFIHLIRRAYQEKIISYLTVEGEDKLETSGSIVIDEEFSRIIESIHNNNFFVKS